MPDQRSAAAERFRRLAARARTLAVVYFLILFAGTHVPQPPQDAVSISDKWLHLAGYAVLTLCVLTGWELTIGKLEPKHFFAVWLAGTIYAAIDELTQIPVGRVCDRNDWFADVLGIVVGLAAFQFGRATIRPFLSSAAGQ
jgi:VanZ family protein